MSIVVVGSIAFDDLETPTGKRERVLGGAATHFAAASSFFVEGVKMVGVVGHDFAMNDLDFLKERDVDVSQVQINKDGRTFHWKGRYGNDLNEAQTLDTQLNVFATFCPELTEDFQKLPYLFLANIDPVLQRNVLQQMDKPKWIACDTMNFWIEGKRDELLKTIEAVDILLINETEARLLSRERNLVKAAAIIQDMGPSVVVIKRGEYGALLFSCQESVQETFSAPALPLSSVIDPTGAGDSFAGGFLGYLARVGTLDSKSLRQAMICGSVMASFNVEAFGCERMQQLNWADIANRYRQFQQLIHFEIPNF
ncbi:MAG: sugar kinase [Deltaproteobacteria bacterium CG11_big_fil_rev_8_21_14_0_20_47_16]|nr:MAG: sugar kinase [Deltaproteobacteria bacterium CG11_big_fil_rev_8_21_14_0_20_47_16]